MNQMPEFIWAISAFERPVTGEWINCPTSNADAVKYIRADRASTPAPMGDEVRAREYERDCWRQVVVNAQTLSDKLREENTQLRLELAKSKEQWRPIADAPRDGTWILVYDRECDIPCPVFWCDDRWCYGTGAYETFHDPKEWLPLPPPPAIPSEPNCGRVECICGRCK